MAPDCVQIEPARAATTSVSGLPAILAKEAAMQATVAETHSIVLSEPVIAGDYFSVSMVFDLTLQERGRVQLSEIGVYRVRQGKIVSEQFFY